MAQEVPLAVILGPLTRLGRAWLDDPAARDYEVLLVTRHGADRERLAAIYPQHRVWGDDGAPALEIAGRSRIAVIACALGLIHPEAPNWDRHAPAVKRDLDALTTIVDACGAAQVHVVYISSVLALAPRGTAWYGGWKNVVEDAVATTVAEHPGARLSVLFPGRLIPRRGAALPESLLSTTFGALARQVGGIVAGDRPVRRIVGLDARAWLTLRSVAALVRIVLNRF
jgi:hypothetical protein